MEKAMLENIYSILALLGIIGAGYMYFKVKPASKDDGAEE